MPDLPPVILASNETAGILGSFPAFFPGIWCNSVCPALIVRKLPSLLAVKTETGVRLDRNARETAGPPDPEPIPRNIAGVLGSLQSWTFLPAGGSQVFWPVFRRSRLDGGAVKNFRYYRQFPGVRRTRILKVTSLMPVFWTAFWQSLPFDSRDIRKMARKRSTKLWMLFLELCIKCSNICNFFT